MRRGKVRRGKERRKEGKIKNIYLHAWNFASSAKVNNTLTVDGQKDL